MLMPTPFYESPVLVPTLAPTKKSEGYFHFYKKEAQRAPLLLERAVRGAVCTPAAGGAPPHSFLGPTPSTSVSLCQGPEPCEHLCFISVYFVPVSKMCLLVSEKSRKVICWVWEPSKSFPHKSVLHHLGL